MHKTEEASSRRRLLGHVKLPKHRDTCHEGLYRVSALSEVRCHVYSRPGTTPSAVLETPGSFVPRALFGGYEHVGMI